MTKILYKVALNTINPTHPLLSFFVGWQQHNKPTDLMYINNLLNK